MCLTRSEHCSSAAGKHMSSCLDMLECCAETSACYSFIITFFVEELLTAIGCVHYGAFNAADHAVMQNLVDMSGCLST